MKNSPTRSPSLATARSDFELWLRWTIGSGVLGVATFIEVHFLRKQHFLRKAEASTLLKAILKLAVLKIWRWVCVPIWELDGSSNGKRPFSSGANVTFQQLSTLVTAWNARFKLDCWTDEECAQ